MECHKLINILFAKTNPESNFSDVRASTDPSVLKRLASILRRVGEEVSGFNSIDFSRSTTAFCLIFVTGFGKIFVKLSRKKKKRLHNHDALDALSCDFLASKLATTNVISLPKRD